MVARARLHRMNTSLPIVEWVVHSVCIRETYVLHAVPHFLHSDQLGKAMWLVLDKEMWAQLTWSPPSQGNEKSIPSSSPSSPLQWLEDGGKGIPHSRWCSYTRWSLHQSRSWTSERKSSRAMLGPWETMREGSFSQRIESILKPGTFSTSRTGGYTRPAQQDFSVAADHKCCAPLVLHHFKWECCWCCLDPILLLYVGCERYR